MTAEQVTRIAAYGLVLRDGRILLCRLYGQATTNAGEWTLPGGGIEFGENPAAAAKREIAEETGLDVRVGELLDVDSVVIKTEGATYHSLRIIYKTEVLGGELTYEADGSTDMCAWFSPAEAASMPLVGLARTGIEPAFPRTPH